jgi:hypothetical protein
MIEQFIILANEKRTEFNQYALPSLYENLLDSGKISLELFPNILKAIQEMLVAKEYCQGVRVLGC